jgi:hypothetical protein
MAVILHFMMILYVMKLYMGQDLPYVAGGALRVLSLCQAGNCWGKALTSPEFILNSNCICFVFYPVFECMTGQARQLRVLEAVQSLPYPAAAGSCETKQHCCPVSKQITFKPPRCIITKPCC